MNRFLFIDTIDDLSQTAAHMARQALAADDAQCLLLDEAGERLHDPHNGHSVPLEGPGFAPWSVFNRQTVVANTAPEDERRDPDRPEALVVAATPLLSQGRIVGALEVSRRSASPFSDGDRGTLEALAQEVATGLVTVQLRDDLSTVMLYTGEWLVAAQEAVAPGGQGHIWRVSQLCAELADGLAFSSDDRQRIWLSARYHDLGWVLGGQSDVLSLRRTHPLVGAQALRAVRQLGAIAGLVEAHHERFDGSGYPQGLTGGAMSLEACILSLAEDVDEVVSARKAESGFQSPAELMEVVAGFIHVQGISHHPRVVAALDTIAGQGKLRLLYY